jgi:heme-degrading monooxygenase HmoA
MFINISIFHPRKGKEQLLIDSMHRYDAAARSQLGLREVHTLHDAVQGALVGLAIWDSVEAFQAAHPALIEATTGDDFADWEEGITEGYHLVEV